LNYHSIELTHLSAANRHITTEVTVVQSLNAVNVCLQFISSTMYS